MAEFNVIGYDNQILGQVEATEAVGAWSKALREFSEVLDVRQIEGFIMYHSTPIKNIELIKQEGIKRSIQRLPTYRTPTEPVVYFTSAIGTAIDYAEGAWEYYRMIDPKWAIFEIEYDEFPTEYHLDVVWGIPGVYWADIDIPPEHVKLHGIFDVEQHRWI